MRAGMGPVFGLFPGHRGDLLRAGRPAPPLRRPKRFGQHAGGDRSAGQTRADGAGREHPPRSRHAPDPNTLFASVMFKVQVDPGSFRFVTSSGTILNPWDLPGSSYLRKYFDGDQSILFYGRQTYGDETTGVSRLIKDGISNSADMGVVIGGESESGTQILERLVGNDDIKGACPTAAVCIRSMVWKPVAGQVKTFCYKTPRQGAELFPYPLPDFR